MDEDQDLFGADLSGVEPQKDFTTAKSDVYDLQVPEDGVSVEIYGDNKDRLRADIRFAFVDPEKVETVGEGVLGNIFHRIYLNSAKGAGFIRAFVEGVRGDWDAVRAQIAQGSELDIPARQALCLEIFRQFVGATCQAKVKRETHYKDRETKALVELDNPRNAISKFVIPKEEPSA